MTHPKGCFWFEATAINDINDLRRTVWFYVVGIDDDTPVALVAGPDDYTACARARIITKALNDAALAMVIAANHDSEGD